MSATTGALGMEFKNAMAEEEGKLSYGSREAEAA